MLSCDHPTLRVTDENNLVGGIDACLPDGKQHRLLARSATCSTHGLNVGCHVQRVITIAKTKALGSRDIDNGSFVPRGIIK
jgi:hypothetical protein